MAVRNLGTVRRRPSVLSGLSEGLAQGIEIAKIAQNEKVRRTQEKASENKLAADLASQEIRKSERDIANVRKTHDMFSLQFNSMDAQQQAIFKGSDQYKELVKFFKGFSNLVPGLINDNGEIVASTNKDIIKNKFEQRVIKAKEKVAAGVGTQEDIQLLRLDSNKQDLIIDALADASRANKGDTSEAGILERAMGSIQKFFGAGDKSQSLSSPADQLPATPIAPVAAPPGATSPQQAVNPATGGLRDPLGILK